MALWQFKFGRARSFKTMIRLVCVWFCVCVANSLVCVSTSAATETCIASQYGYAGSQTASGERMNPHAMTAAHRTKSFGSQVTVTLQKTGRSVTVRINDRGPFVRGRCIDLSTAAAHALGMGGTERVSLN
jgi:rare lipoprotein A